MADAMFVGWSFLAQPVKHAIAAVTATDVMCTGCVNSSYIADNAIAQAQIEDREIKAANFAAYAGDSSETIPNSVGAVELQMHRGQCQVLCCQASLDVKY